MKKLTKLFLVIAIALTSNQLFAQAFDDGKNLISLGFGFPPTSEITQSLTTYQNDQDYDYKNYGTVILKYEHGFAKYFGIGLSAEYSGANVTYQYTVHRVFNPDTNYKVNINNNVFGAYLRLNGHYPIGDKFDIFAGVGLGYLYIQNNSTDNNPNSTSNDYKTQSLVFNAQFTLGARYMIKDHIGLFAEVGWASTNVQVGVTFGF